MINPAPNVSFLQNLLRNKPQSQPQSPLGPAPIVGPLGTPSTVPGQQPMFPGQTQPGLSPMFTGEQNQIVPPPPPHISGQPASPSPTPPSSSSDSRDIIDALGHFISSHIRSTPRFQLGLLNPHHTSEIMRGIGGGVAGSLIPGPGTFAGIAAAEKLHPGGKSSSDPAAPSPKGPTTGSGAPIEPLSLQATLANSFANYMQSTDAESSAELKSIISDMQSTANASGDPRLKAWSDSQAGLLIEQQRNNEMQMAQAPEIAQTLNRIQAEAAKAQAALINQVYSQPVAPPATPAK